MRALAIIDGAQSGAAVANLAATLGISETQARAAVEAALPEMIRSVERNTLSRAGLADFVSAIGDGHHEQVLDTPAVWTDPRVIADGEAALAHIMGSERNVESLTANTAQAAGLGSSLVKMLLPILAQWLLGALTKSTKGGLGDILSRLPIPGGGTGQRPNSRPRSPSDDGRFDTGGTMGDPSGFDLPKSDVPAGGYPMPPIPASPGADNYGRDAASRRSGNALPFPLPGPGDRGGSDNPYGDLSDILRRGGRLPSGDPVGGRGLGSVVRDTIGGVLGFGKKGIFGWIIQLLLLRWGWTFLRRILLGR